MAESGSDSEASLKGWTVVDDRGEVEASDSSSTSSSLEFVQLEEHGAQYKRRSSKGGHGPGPDPTPGPAAPESAAAVEADPGDTERPENLGPLGDPVTLDNEPSPTDSDSQQEEEVVSDQIDMTFEPLTPDPSDDLDLDQATPLVPPGKDEENFSLPEPILPPHLEKVLGEAADQDEQIEHLAAALVRQESDSDSDFVQLDPQQEGVAGGGVLLPEVLRDLESSATSTGSRASSSISAHFRFVNPPVIPNLGPRRDEGGEEGEEEDLEEEEEEEDSLMGDFDDRCESDISGVATDDTDSDLSNMIYSIGDLPLTAGRRLYRHRPNSSLNSVLTIISMMALCLAIGIGVGHYLGMSREGWLRQMQVVKMKHAQDNHLLCLNQADHLKDKIRRLSGSTTDSTCGRLQDGVNVGKSPCPRVPGTAGADELAMGPDSTNKAKEPEQANAPKDSIPDSANPELKPPQSNEKDANTEVEMKKYVQRLRSELNQLQMENADLRAEVTRLRYTAHPANAHVNAAVTQRQLKVKVNQLAVENQDLKSAVGKMRYTVHPGNEDNTTEESEKPEAENAPVGNTEMVVLEEKLKNVSLELTAEKKMNAYLQGALVTKKQAAEQKRDSPKVEAPASVLSCVRKHWPGVVSLSSEYLDKAGEKTQKYWAKLNEATKTTKNQIIDKWNEIRKLMNSKDIKELKLPEELEKLLQMAWKVAEGGTGMDGNNNPGETKPGHRSRFSWKNITKPMKAHFQDYVNKTKLTMSKLTDTLQETWQKVKNLSKELLSNEGHVVMTDQEKKEEKVSASEALHENKWEKEADNHQKRRFDGKHEEKRNYHHHHPHYKGHHHHKHHQDHHDKHHDQKQRQTHGPHQQRDEKNDRPPYMDNSKEFEDKPYHKQRQSNHEQYNDFWKKVEYDPDDFFHEGFFEGNQRQWQKHQKRLKQIHGRIHRLNEDILYSMDDDDIEDIYDDLDDIQDDLEDEDQPQNLQTWLACQVRWWKSRLHRKHRSEDLIRGCGKQIMQWQLRALCKEQCVGKKCKKERKWNPRSHPLCQHILQSQDSSCHRRGQTNQCHNDIKDKKGFHSTPLKSQKAHLKSSQENIAKPPSQKPADLPPSMPTRAKMPEEDKLFTMDPPQEVSDLEEKANNTASEEEGVSLPSSESNTSPPSLHGSSDGVIDQTTDTDASWVFERAVLREYHHHNPDWVFERAAERDLERNKPWYVRRSEEREYRRLKQEDDQEYHP